MGENSGASAADYLSALSNPISTAVASIFNYNLNERRNEQAIEQWNRENEYNLPINQVQRLQDAGLNPALMYENGASGLLSAQSPDITQSEVNLRGVDPLTAAQIRALDAKTEATKDANDRENEKQEVNMGILKQQYSKLGKEIDEFKFKYDEIKERTQLYYNLGDESLDRSTKLTQEWLFLVDSYDARLRRVINESDESGYKYVLTKTNARFLESTLQKQLDLVDSIVNLNESHVSFYNEKINEIQAQIERWDDMTTNERLQMAVDVFGDLLDIGQSIFSRGLVKERVTTERGGGKPTKRTTVVERTRKAKK